MKKPRQHFMEWLERREFLAADSWIGGSGNWDTAANWSSGQVPGIGDDVTINQAGATVTVSGDYNEIHSLTTTNSTLSITGGSLIVLANSTIAGSLSMTGGALTASGSGTTLAASGATTVTFDAEQGGQLNLSALTNLAAAQETKINDTGDSAILDPKLTDISGVSFSTDGTDQNVADAWTAFTGGHLTVTAGALTFANLADFASSGLSLSGGAALSFPVLTQGNLTLSDGASVTIQGVLVGLPASGANNATINIPASQGLSITIDASGSVTGVMVNVGAGSTLVLNGEVTYTSPGGNVAVTSANGNLQIVLAGSIVSSTPLDDVTSLTVNGATGTANSFTLDYTKGTFVVPGGITFNGGALPATPSNSLSILGGSFDVDHRPGGF